MPGNSTAVRVREHANRVAPPFKRQCLAALMIVLVGTAEAQEEYLVSADTEHDALSADEFERSTGRSGDVHYSIRDGYAIAQGDIVLGRVDDRGRLLHRNMGRGLGLNNSFGRWSNGVITYTISDEISEQKRINIVDAIKHINDHTRISILERTSELATQYPNNWVNFVDGSACASYVGANAGDSAAQNIWVAQQCNTGSVIHEIAHTIGLFHEHTRPDRNQYIRVLEENIQEGSEHNFAIIQAGADNYSLYDYGSIMHYGEYFFSTNPVLKKTIEAPNGESIGQREKLSEKDTDAINAMYATDLSLSVDTSEIGEQQEIDVSISNNGSLGAHRIYARLALPSGGQWLSVSRESGWDCTSDDEELTCSRDTLEGGELSRFILLAESDNGNPDDLIVVLQSRTLDKNLSNNSLNDDGRWADLEDVLPDPQESDGNSSQDNGDEVPAIGASTPQGKSSSQEGSEPDAATSVNDSSNSESGGGVPSGSIVLLGMIAGYRRWRSCVASRQQPVRK